MGFPTYQLKKVTRGEVIMSKDEKLRGFDTQFGEFFFNLHIRGCTVGDKKSNCICDEYKNVNIARLKAFIVEEIKEEK